MINALLIKTWSTKRRMNTNHAITVFNQVSPKRELAKLALRTRSALFDGAVNANNNWNRLMRASVTE